MFAGASCFFVFSGGLGLLRTLAMYEAKLYSSLSDEKVRCYLCSHRCIISEGKRGVCGVRENQGGKLYSLVYDKVVAIHVDPIEKKPFFHFQPGSRSLSIATVGCNFKCKFCQNYSISQHPFYSKSIPGEEISPEEIVETALGNDCQSISYTYTEPTVFFELAYDTGVKARKLGLSNTFVTNGFMTHEAIDEMCDFLDAANVDLKSFSEQFYREYCNGRLDGVLSSIEYLHKKGIWVEITTLIIPGLNSSREEIREIAKFIKSVSPSIPWHVSAFHPDYKMLQLSTTPIHLLEEAYRIGKEEGLEFIYCGNVPGHPMEKTRCPGCGMVLIERRGFYVSKNELKENKCPKCGRSIPVILKSLSGESE